MWPLLKGKLFFFFFALSSSLSKCWNQCFEPRIHEISLKSVLWHSSFSAPKNTKLTHFSQNDYCKRVLPLSQTTSWKKTLFLWLFFFQFVSPWNPFCFVFIIYSCYIVVSCNFYWKKDSIFMNIELSFCIFSRKDSIFMTIGLSFCHLVKPLLP